MAIGGEGYMKKETEVGVLQPGAKECGPPPEALRVKDQVLPWSLQRAQPC